MSWKPRTQQLLKVFLSSENESAGKIYKHIRTWCVWPARSAVWSVFYSNMIQLCSAALQVLQKPADHPLIQSRRVGAENPLKPAGWWPWRTRTGVFCFCLKRKSTLSRVNKGADHRCSCGLFPCVSSGWLNYPIHFHWISFPPPGCEGLQTLHSPFTAAVFFMLVLCSLSEWVPLTHWHNAVIMGPLRSALNTKSLGGPQGHSIKRRWWGRANMVRQRDWAEWGARGQGRAACWNKPTCLNQTAFRNFYHENTMWGAGIYYNKLTADHFAITYRYMLKLFTKVNTWY